MLLALLVLLVLTHRTTYATAREIAAAPPALDLRSNPNVELFSMFIIRILKNYPDSSDFLKLFSDFLGRERGRVPRGPPGP